MAKTLPLDPVAWDLVLDSAGNLNLADPDTSIAQGVASAIRTFLGECWYNVNLGMPYFQDILGKNPPASLLVANIETQAETIDGVDSVRVISLRLVNRQLAGTVIINSPVSSTPIVASF